MCLHEWWLARGRMVKKHTKSALQAIWRFLKSPGLWIVIMVLFGIGLILGGVVTYDYYCNSGTITDGWCGIVGKQFPWTVITGIATVPAVILTWYWRDKHKRRDIEIAQNGQVTERYTRAVDQLGNRKVAVRLGGIYALERIARDSPQDHWTIMETLAAFIRMSAPLKNGDDNRDDAVEPDDFPSPTIDVQAALTVIGRRNTKNDLEDGTIDLSETDISGAQLKLACFKGVQFINANLTKVNFKEATLVGARFFRANLYGASLQSANLQSANFFGANLKQAYLSGARFSGTTLTASDLRMATIESAAGLTREQLQQVILDHNTTLPPEFTDLLPQPPHTDKPA